MIFFSLRYQVLFKIFILYFLILSKSHASLTLDEALRSTAENNFTLKSYNAEFDAVKSEKYKALGAFFPIVSLDISRGEQDTQIGSDTDFKGDVDKKNINVTQNIFNGGRNIFNIKRANSILKREGENRNIRRQSLFMNVVEVYIDLLRNKELLEISQQNLKSQKELLLYIKKKFNAGYATKLEWIKVIADVGVAASNMTIINNNINTNKAVFYSLTNIEYNIGEPLEKIEKELIEKKELNIEKIYKKSVNFNSEIKSAKFSYMISKYESIMAKSALLPEVTFNFQSSEDENSLFFNNRAQRNNAAFVNVSINLLNSGIGISNLNQSHNKVKQEKYSFESAKINLKQSISEEIFKIHNLKSQYNAAKQLEVASEELIKGLEIEGNFGDKSVLDLLIAKKEFYQVKANKVGYHYDTILAYFRLSLLEGKSIF